MITKEREILKNIYNERLDTIEELTKKINFDDLKYVTESRSMETDFSTKKDPVTFFNGIKTGRIAIKEAKDSQEDFIKYLKRIRRRNKTDPQRETLSNINMLFNGRNDSIKFVEDYCLMILEGKKKQLKVKDLKY